MTEKETFSDQSNNLHRQADEKAAKMTENRETNITCVIPLGVALIAAGLAGNYFNLSLFLNIDFLFGSIFAMLALQFFGLGRGIVAAAIIASYTYLLWNHPYAIIIMTAEVAVVGWLMGRGKVGMVLADTIYWLVIGMPLAYFFFHVVMHIPFSNTSIVMTKQAVNGIANALVARLIFTGFTLWLRSSLTSYREIIYNLLTFFILCPALIMLAISGRNDFNETDLRIRISLMQDSRRVAHCLETWVMNRTSSIVNLADMAASISRQQMQSYLELAKKSDVNFLRIGLLDKEATITAYFPLLDELGQNNIGKNFADRPFIPTLKQTLKPMLSEVVMGRVGVPMPMVTMLAPVIIHGEYGGYVTGILSLEQIREDLDESMNENALLYTLIDKNGNVIMTNRTDQTVLAHFVRGKGTLNHFDAGISQWIPVVSPNTAIMERWKNSFYVAETNIGNLAEWKLILEQPVAPFQETLHDNYTGKLTLLFLTLLGALVLAELLSRRSIATLEKLRLITYDLPGRLFAECQGITWPESGIMETNHLINNFREMSDLLTAQFNEIRQSNELLEQRVEERTEALRESEERLSLALKASRDAVWDWNLLTNTIYYSPHWWDMVGYAENELKADPDLWRRLMHPEDLERASSIVSEAITGTVENSFEVECRLLHKNGHYVPVLTRGFVLRDDSAKPVRVSGTNTDLTQRKKIEKERIQWERQWQQLQKVDSLNRMAGAIAHHFNNQLQVVMGNLEMAMDNAPNCSETFETLAEAMKASRSAADVSSLMLTYLGQTRGKHEPLDLSETCQISLSMLRTIIPNKVIVASGLPSPGPTIRANVNQMHQVITNLVTNAWESFYDKIGTIKLAVKTFVSADIPESHRFPIDWRPQEIDYACLEISDTGCGISNRDIEKIFDPFFTTKFTGRGLGLPVVMGMVKAHGGGITVDSDPGHGSVFRIFLPISTEEVPRQSDLSAIQEVLPTGEADKFSKIEGGGTMLLIEDENQVRDMAKIMLTRLGYTVLEAKDGVEALEIFQQHQNDICCVLSDLTMPRMNGWDTLAALRKISPDIPVILSSGYDEAQVMADEHPERPNAFLGKPYQFKGLGDIIRRVLANKLN